MLIKIKTCTSLYYHQSEFDILTVGYNVSTFGQVSPNSRLEQELMMQCQAKEVSNIQVRPHLDSADSKFKKYIPAGTTNMQRIALLVEELKQNFVFSEISHFSGRPCLTENDTCSLLSILDDLGYSNISFHHKGTCFLTMKAVFRFTEVLLKIGWASNSDLGCDPCVREAVMYLDIQGEYGKIYMPRYCPYDEFSSSADVLAIDIGSSTFSVATTQMADCCLCEKFNEMASRAHSSPELSFVLEVIELLYQVLKLYQVVHHRDYALIRDPRRLMMLCCRDGHGCHAVSRVKFKGKSYALVVGSAAYCQKQGFLYLDTELTAKGSDDKNDKSITNGLGASTTSNRSARILSGVKIAAFFAERKELVGFSQTSAERKKVSARRRDLQLIAETFIKLLLGHSSQGDLDFDGSQSLVQEEHADLEEAAFVLFAVIRSRMACNKTLNVDNTIESQPGLAESYAMVYSRMPQEYKELLKLLCRLQSSKDITSTDALESYIFDSHKKEDAWRQDPWRQHDIPDWSLLPSMVTENLWRKIIFPKCQHYYVNGGPYDVGEGKVLHLKAVWLVYECVGDIKGHDAWQRTVRLAEEGKKDDVVAVYACPLTFKSSIDLEFLDVRWTLIIKSSDDWLYNGRTCGMFNPFIAVKRQQVAAYINSSKDKQGKNNRASSQHEFFRKRFGLPMGQNCTIYYPHGWHRRISKDRFLEKPWLGTIAFKLTSNQEQYAELAYPYDWRKWDSEYHLKFMKQTSAFAEQYKQIRLRSKTWMAKG